MRRVPSCYSGLSVKPSLSQGMHIIQEDASSITDPLCQVPATLLLEDSVVLTRPVHSHIPDAHHFPYKLPGVQIFLLYFLSLPIIAWT